MHVCKQCEKEFSTTEGLEHHQKSKHNHSTKKIKIKKKYISYAIVIILLAATIGFTYNSISGPGKYDEIAKCLTESGAKFYGAFWCPHCSEQKALFGKSLKYVNYIECSTPDRQQTAVCQQAVIESYPTWEFSDGTRRSGLVPLVELAQKTACSLET